MSKSIHSCYLILFLTINILPACKKEGPKTIVTGRVTDKVTGEPYSGLALQLTRDRATWSGTATDRFEIIYTDVNGNYMLTFVTDELNASSNHWLYFKDYLPDYGYLHIFKDNDEFKLKIGQTNQINFKISKLIKLQVRISNKTNHNYPAFSLNSNSDCGCIFVQLKGGSILRDTVMQYKVPRMEPITFTSSFYEPNTVNGYVNFYSDSFIGMKDTTVNILNE